MPRLHAAIAALPALLIIVISAALPPAAMSQVACNDSTGIDGSSAHKAGTMHKAGTTHKAGTAHKDSSAHDGRTGPSPGPHSLVMDDTASVAANPGYATGGIRELLLGRSYREAWVQSIEAPTLNLNETSGGLTVIGSAGGGERTLFLVGENGDQYVLRTLDKDVGPALPAVTRRTIVQEIAQDQISSLHPYGAFIVPEMARAAGLLYTHPVLVFIPDSPRLGEHRDAFAGRAAMLERNVTADVSDTEQFKHSVEIIDTDKLIDRVEAGPEHQVDERAYLKARLFDMLIGDRDRHDKQFVWAAFEVNGRTRYVPVPIDRTFAFARFDGLLPRIARATGDIRLRKLTNFDEDLDNLIGLNYQGAKLDYRFTSGLDHDDWIETARELQDRITDDVIERAVGVWPDVLIELSGSVTIADLKARRDDLENAADTYYEVMARRVDVIGSDAPEQFTVRRTGEQTVEVVISVLDTAASASPSTGTQIASDLSVEKYASSGGPGPAANVAQTYRRTFKGDATAEIRLFGLGGADRFLVGEGGTAGIFIRVIGGDGSDTFLNESPDRGRLLRFYDTWVDGDEIERGAHIVVLADSAANRYQMHRFELNKTAPIFSFHYDSDQGAFVGGGVRMVRFGFRKKPYAARHLIMADYGPKSEGYNVRYEGHLIDLWKNWDAVLEADLLAEDVFRHFYGLGNETPPSNREMFDARFRWITASPALEKTFGPAVSLRLGPHFEAAQIRPPRGRTIGDPEVGYTNVQMTNRYVGGFGGRLEVDSRDSTMMPRSGFLWITDAGGHLDLMGGGVRFARLSSELTGYGSVGPFTLALRAGGARNLGEFAFYQANFLSGDRNVRGFKKRRFAGRSSAYGNAELRLDLSEINAYVLRGHLGVLGFADVGRVWADGESSTVWHQGYGGGLWITPFDQFVMTATMAFSKEGSIFDLSFDLFF